MEFEHKMSAFFVFAIQYMVISDIMGMFEYL